MKLRIVRLIAFSLIRSSFGAAAMPCDSTKALQQMILNLNVDSGSWKSSYTPTIDLKFRTRPTKAVSYIIEGLGSRDQLAVVLFEQTGQCNFKSKILDTFYQEGVEPEILAIFTVNA